MKTSTDATERFVKIVMCIIFFLIGATVFYWWGNMVASFYVPHSCIRFEELAESHSLLEKLFLAGIFAIFMLVAYGFGHAAGQGYKKKKSK